MSEFDLSAMAPRQTFGLLNGLVAPRPIALVSTLSPEGDGNLAPFSFFMLGGSNPASCAICPINDREGKLKDTIRNIEQTKEYVISACTREFAEAMVQTSYPYDHGDDEFAHSGLSRAPSKVVAPPRVAESPIHLECRAFEIVRHGSGPLASNYIIGEILHVAVQDDLLVDGVVDDTKVGFIGRLGAAWYTHITPENMFEMARPKLDS